MILEDLGADAPMKIGFVTEPDEVPTLVRDGGFEETIASNPNAEIVAKVDGNVKPDDSLQATLEMLQGNPDINVIFANTGPGAYGALQAVQSLGRDDVLVYGFCASEEPLTEIHPGCVAQEPYDYGAIGQISEWLTALRLRSRSAALEDLLNRRNPCPGRSGAKIVEDGRHDRPRSKRRFVGARGFQSASCFLACRRYGALIAVRPGQHGLAGHNGAGKSTLLKVLSGAYRLMKALSCWMAKDRAAFSRRCAGPRDRHGASRASLLPNLTATQNAFRRKNARLGFLQSKIRKRKRTRCGAFRPGHRRDPADRRLSCGHAPTA